MSRNQKNNSKKVLLFIASVSVIILIYCMIRLTIYSLNSYKANKEIDELKQQTSTVSAIPSAAFDNSVVPSADAQESAMSSKSSSGSKYMSLLEQNSDFAGWIKIEGTKIDYPVMQTVSDEEYYLHRSFAKEYSDEGLPFIDSACDIARPSTNIIIYGHNMKNGDMFADLLKYSDSGFWKDHKTINFDTVFQESTYTVISVFRIDVSDESPENLRFYEFINNTESYTLEQFLSEIKEKSAYEIPFETDKITHIITLSTCEYTKKDGRFVVIAAKTSD